MLCLRVEILALLFLAQSSIQILGSAYKKYLEETLKEKLLATHVGWPAESG